MPESLESLVQGLEKPEWDTKVWQTPATGLWISELLRYGTQVKRRVHTTESFAVHSARRMFEYRGLYDRG